MDEEREAAKARVGSMLKGKWRLEKLLGVGGMAAVYEATHRIGRRDAIKILHPTVASSRELRERFEQEAHAVNRFTHPGAVEIRDIDITDEGEPFLVMELLDVLAAAHAEGIIHRDIKPDNLFIQQDGRLKVLDFGIARMREGASRSNLTMVGARLGTVPYMPPEQVRGLPIDVRADLFAVGAMMFRLIARRRVHEAPSEAEMVAKMTMDPAVPLSFAAENTPTEVCMVVDRALAFDRERRYPDAATMQQDVRAARRGQEPMFAARAIESSGQPNEGMTRDVVSELFVAAPAVAAVGAAGSAAAASALAEAPTAATNVATAGQVASMGEQPTAAAAPVDAPTSAASPSAMATGGGDATGLVAGAAPVSPTVVSEGAPLPPSQATPASVPAVAMIDAAPASVAPASTQAPLSGLPAVEAVAASQATPGSAAMGLGTPASVTRADDHHLPLAAAAIGIVFLVVLLAVGATVWALGGTGDEGAGTAPQASQPRRTPPKPASDPFDDLDALLKFDED